ncbi:MAG: S8 family serine peptidase [Actinomycetota bacterium]
MHKYKFVLAIAALLVPCLALSFCWPAARIFRYAQKTSYSHTWNLEMINLANSWDITRGSENVMVAVIGWGIDKDNPHLEGRVTGSLDYVTGKEEVIDPNGHDTFAAGIVLSIAPEVSIITLRVMDSDGRDVGRLHEAITYAADQGADIILLPITILEPQPAESYADQVQASIIYAYSKNVRFIIGAQGRGGHHSRRFPGYLSGIYNVAGVDEHGNYSLQSTANDLNFISAPGENIPGIETPGNWQQIGGTSWSSAHLAGVAALMVSANPLLNNEDIEDILVATAQDRGIFGKDIYYGHGLVDCYASVRASRDCLYTNLADKKLDYKSRPCINNLDILFNR